MLRYLVLTGGTFLGMIVTSVTVQILSLRCLGSGTHATAQADVLQVGPGLN